MQASAFDGARAGFHIILKRFGIARLRTRPCMTLLMMSLSATPAFAQRWNIDPRIDAQATFTNNANYDAGGERESDLILNLLPSLSVTYESRRLRVNGTAGLNLIGYVDGTQTSRMLPQANLLANLEAIERFFYIEAALLANQELLNPFLPQSDEASTFNKYTYAQGRIAPYLQGNIGNNARYLVRSDNTYTITTQTDVALPDVYYGRHVAEIVRDPVPLGGGLRFQRDDTRFDDADSLWLNAAVATVNYAFTPQITLGLRGGYERTNYTTSDSDGSIYGVEAAIAFNPRTSLIGFYEHRFFGPNYQVDFSNRQRTLAVNLSASRSINTFPELLFQLPATGNVSSLLNSILIARFPDPIERARETQQLIDRQALPSSLTDAVNILSNTVNVVTSASGSLAWIGVRNTLAFNLYRVETNQLPDVKIPPSFILFNNNTQRGGSVTLSHRLNPLTTLNATFTRRETRGVDESAGLDTDQNIFEAQASRQLTQRSGAFIGARYQKQHSTSTVFGDSSEAAVLLGFYYWM